MRRALAIHKSLVSAASDLQLSLQHGETEPATIVEFVDPDLIVEHLPTWRVWRYLTEDKFWLMRRLWRPPSEPAPQETRVRRYTSYLTRDSAGRPLTCRGVIEDSDATDSPATAPPPPDSRRVQPPPLPDSRRAQPPPLPKPTTDPEWDVDTEPFLKNETLAALTRPRLPPPTDWAAEEGTPTTSPGTDKPAWPPAKRLPRPR